MRATRLSDNCQKRRAATRRSSPPDLIRRSIVMKSQFFTRWFCGTSPRMTSRKFVPFVLVPFCPENLTGPSKAGWRQIRQPMMKRDGGLAQNGFGTTSTRR
ncbi:hypothetical protein J2S22_003082 [Rhodoplanes tepidamans]|nr:hypothetical protein [Rhodoplanes tepidamans]